MTSYSLLEDVAEKGVVISLLEWVDFDYGGVRGDLGQDALDLEGKLDRNDQLVVGGWQMFLDGPGPPEINDMDELKLSSKSSLQCACCQKRLSSKQILKRHLHDVHGMNTDLEPIDVRSKGQLVREEPYSWERMQEGSDIDTTFDVDLLDASTEELKARVKTGPHSENPCRDVYPCAHCHRAHCHRAYCHRAHCNAPHCHRFTDGEISSNDFDGNCIDKTISRLKMERADCLQNIQLWEKTLQIIT